MVRPSKSFLFDMLERQLRNTAGDIGVDAGAADLKNRKMFKTQKYFGLDIDLDGLRKGVQKHSDGATFGILADLTKLDALPDNSVDVVVTTNTLHHVPYPQRNAALKHLCRLTAPQGRFLCELSLDQYFKEALKIMQSYFKNVQIVYYKNPVSRAYEWIFEKDGYLGSHPIAGRRTFRLFAWLLSRLEYLTCHFPSMNKHAFIICSDKYSGVKQAFDVSRLALIHENIYDLIQKN